MAKKCPKCQSDNPGTATFCADCGTQLPSIQDIEVTETIEAPKEELTRGTTFADRYEIIEELGKGGMGRVYRVEDKKLDQEVALKLIKPEIASDKKTIERFRNELKTARIISHKNVCRMFDLGESGGSNFITMEYIRGEDLKSLVRKMGQLSAGQALAIAKQVCDGLIEAHNLGVVHRDLKPQNIMIDTNGNARIMDFGIARSIEGKGITGAGVMIGTPDYMSPEQVDGKEIDQRSDVYSLGVILYEMVTGRAPFEGDTALSIAVKHKTEIPPDPRKYNKQLSEELSQIIMRCLEKDKENRFQDAVGLRKALTDIEKGIPTTERIVPTRKPLTSREITVQFSLKKLFIPALIVIAVVVIGLIIWQILPKQKASPLALSGKPSLAVMYFENNTGDEKLDHWRKAIAELLITDLSQSKFIRVLGRDRLFNILSQINLLEAKSYSSDDIKEVASRSGVNHILQGAFVKAGDNFRISYTLQNTSSGEQIGSGTLSGTGEESIFSMVDDMTKTIKENFRFTEEEIASDIDKDVRKITTSSPEAYKYFEEGDRYENVLGDEQTALQLYEMAVAIDPEFASAYLAMSITYWKLGLSSEEKKYLQKAFELKERVSDRERYLIEAEYYSQSEKTYGMAIEAFQNLLELYPDDMWGNNDLGWLYLQIEEWDEAIERLEVNIKNKDRSYTSYQMIAGSYSAKGLYDKAKEVFETYLQNFPDSPQIRSDLAYTYFREGKIDLALEEIDKALSVDPIDPYFIYRKAIYLMSRGDLISSQKECEKLVRKEDALSHMIGLGVLSQLNLLKGKYSEAINLIKQMIEAGEKSGTVRLQSYILQGLAYSYLNSGNHKAALETLNEAWKVAVEREDLGAQRVIAHDKGLVFLGMKSISEAEGEKNSLRELIEQGLNKRHMRYFYHLSGLIELEKQNFPEAINYFEKALTLEPHGCQKSALFINSLASAFYESGNMNRALKEYQRICTLTRGRIDYEDMYAKSFYMIGKIYEQQGDSAKAIEHYEKFLDLWKDADPGMAEVEDAKKRLAGLRETADK